MLTSILAMTVLAGGTIYDFTMKDIRGKDQPLKAYKGKVLLVVNVASKCGQTPQYKGLEELYLARKKDGLVVLGFPANEFGAQEPGTNAEILQFCTTQYSVSFPMFSKIVVKGEGIHPLYRWLVASADRHEEIEWNFAKFLISRDGEVVARFAPRTKPDDPALVKAIEAELKKK